MPPTEDQNSKINEPPPPYPGITNAAPGHDSYLASGAPAYPQNQPPPPYPGMEAYDYNPYANSSTTGVVHPTDVGGIPYEFPHHYSGTTITIPGGDCPRCGVRLAKISSLMLN